MVHRRYARILLSAIGLVFLLASCGLLDFLNPEPAPDIGTPVPDSLSYDLLVLETDPSESFDFTNTGDADLDYTVSVSAGDGWLVIDAGASGTLTEGESQTVDLSATCATADDDTATVTISDDGGTAASQTVDVDLTCTGTLANLFLVAEVGDPAVSETFSFVNTFGASQDFDLTGLPVWLTADPTFGTVAAGASRDIELTADACAVGGAMEATLDLTFSDSGGAPLNVLLPIELSVFSVCATAPSGDFNISVGFFGDNFSAAIIDVFLGAAATLEGIVTADLTDQIVATTDQNQGTSGDSGPNDCFSSTDPALDEVGPLRENLAVDDLHIDAQIPAIDGAFGVLGSAGPCITRSSVDGNPLLPYYGDMRFDSADMDRLLTAGTLEKVILHEMLHVLGIGTLWSSFGILEFESSDQSACRVSSGFTATGSPVVTGPSASTYYGETLLAGPGPVDVPAEDEQGSGSQCAHWDEQVFDNELMTWILDNSQTNLLSALTIFGLEDLGYTVDETQAEPYSLKPCGIAAPPQL